MGRGVRRDDWTPAELLARWGTISVRRAPKDDRRLQVTVRLPWPDNKWPVLRDHLERHGILYHAYDTVGAAWSGGRRYDRPQVSVGIFGGHAVRFFESIGWRCGHERKDRVMRAWRAWHERPRLPVFD